MLLHEDLDDDFDDDDDDDLEFFNAQLSPDTVRIVHGGLDLPSTNYSGVQTMTTTLTKPKATPLTLAGMNATAAAIGTQLGKEIGQKIVAKFANQRTAAPAKPAPLMLQGNVPAVSNLSKDEAAEFVEHLPSINEYSANAAEYAALGMTLVNFIDEKLADEHGIPFHGQPRNMSNTLRSALDKQQEKFATRFHYRGRLGW